MSIKYLGNLGPKEEREMMRKNLQRAFRAQAIGKGDSEKSVMQAIVLGMVEGGTTTLLVHNSKKSLCKKQRHTLKVSNLETIDWVIYQKQN